MIQIIRSQIDLISHTTDLYYSQFCSTEDEDYSLQYSHFIREWVQIKKPLGVGYGFKSHCLSINEHFSKLIGCHQSGAV